MSLKSYRIFYSSIPSALRGVLYLVPGLYVLLAYMSRGEVKPLYVATVFAILEVVLRGSSLPKFFSGSSNAPCAIFRAAPNPEQHITGLEIAELIRALLLITEVIVCVIACLGAGEALGFLSALGFGFCMARFCVFLGSYCLENGEMIWIVLMCIAAMGAMCVAVYLAVAPHETMLARVILLGVSVVLGMWFCDLDRKRVIDKLRKR